VAWITHAPAKVNLDLRMRGLRADGYHLLTTILQSVALADTLTLRARPGPFAIACDTPDVPLDERNLGWRGAAAMAAHLGLSLDDWELGIEKRVPAEAGLGGGSADAAAAARLVATASGQSIDPAGLAEVIRPIGADVAFFAWGGTMRAEGVGDEITSLPDEPAASVLIVRPAFGVATSQAYRWYDEAHPGQSSLVEGVGPRHANDLQGPVAARHPEIAVIVERLRQRGATLAAMSGSGSACFGLFPPGVDLPETAAGWPDGARVWPTRLLARAEYTDLTAVRPSP
jgi:4-diphosphocytidyl-2-C-methyl-D-erythritol kinase